MSNKQRILRMVEKWPEDIPFDKAVYHMNVLQAIVQGIDEADQDEGIEHEEFFKQLLSDEEENHDPVEAKSPKRPRGHQGAHRPGRTKNRS